MRRCVSFILSLTVLFCMAGCAGTNGSKESTNEEKWDRIPMVMVDGVLYLDTGYTNSEIRKCGTFDGEITSEVDGSERPTENDQSNFGTGYGYQYGATEGTIELYMNDKWCIFATEEAREKIQFPDRYPATEPEEENQEYATPPEQTSEIPDDYYAIVTSGSAVEVERFATEIKNDVLSGNWESLSQKIAYPIEIDGKEIASYSDFLNMGLDSTFSQTFVDAIAAESCREMFVSYRGIMMGETGRIWLSDVETESGQWELKIIAINGIIVEDLSAEEVEAFNQMFQPILYDKQGEPIGVNPWSCFFTSYYDDVRKLDFEEFMRYFPGDGSPTSDAEFEALKTVKVWPFDWVETREDMPVPISNYPARLVNAVLKEYAGITAADLDTSDVAYLSEYDAYYNYTSDFGPGMFTCTRGERKGDMVYLYEELDQSTDLLILQGQDGAYQVVSHQRLEGDDEMTGRYA